MDSGYSEVNNGSKILIVSFAGCGKGMTNMPMFEFRHFLTNVFPTANLLFLKDDNKAWYNKGIIGISSDVPTTVEFLREKTKGYDTVSFIGSSAGGYAAILFGSLLNVSIVLAFRPQTIIEKDCMDKKYNDLKGLINSKTLYCIYGETCNTSDDLHSFTHCTRIEGSSNVIVHSKEVIDLKEMRNNGWLKSEFLRIFQIKYSELGNF